MGIDSLGKSTGVPKMASAIERKEGQDAPKALKDAQASRVDISTKRFESTIKAVTKELTEADEARLSNLREQVQTGEYDLNPADIARSVMEDRAFFSALTGAKE